MFLFLLAAFALAQDTLTPTWAKVRPDGAPLYSPDGKYVVTFNSGTNIWRASDGVLVQKVQLGGSGFTFSGDGKSVFTSNGTSIGRYDFPSMAYKGKFFTEPNNSYIYAYDVSHDGKYIVYYNNSGKETLYDLVASRVVKTWSVPSGASYTYFRFTSDSQKIYCDGPTVYDLTGKKLAGKTYYGYFPVASPSGDKIYQVVPSTGKLTAFNTGDLSTAWAVSPGNSFNIYGFAVTTDGKALSSIGSTSSGNAVVSINAATGSDLPSAIVPQNAGNLTFALSPVDSTVWIGYYFYDSTYGYFGNALTASLDSSTGGGTLLNTAPPVHEFGNLSTFSASATSSMGEPLLLGSNGVFFGVKDGNPKGQLSPSPAFYRSQARQQAISPDGRFAASIGYANISNNARYGVIVYRNDTGAAVTYIADTSGHENNDCRAVQWVSSTRLALKRDYSSKKLSLYDFNGTRLTLVKSVACNAGFEMAVSSDSKVAVTGQGASLLWINLDAGTSTAFTVGANAGSDIDSLRFVDGTYRFSVSYDDSNGTGYERTVDLYDSASGTPTLVRSFKQPIPSPGDGYSHGLVSPDGKWVALANLLNQDPNDAVPRHRLTLYRASDGTALRTYDTQLVDNGIVGMEFAADSLHLIYGTASNAMVSVEVPVTVASVSLNPSSVIGGSSSTGTLTLDRATSTDTTVALASDQAFATVPASVTVPAGQTSATFSVSTSTVDANVFAGISATYLGATTTGSLGVTPATALTLGLSPSTVTGGQTSTGTVTLNGPAGPSGVVVSLASNNAAVTVPGSVTVAAGQTSATFTANTVSSASAVTATVSASALSTLSAQATLTVNPAVSADVTLTPTSTKGGLGLLLTVTLSNPAPTGGTSFTLSSDNAALVPPTKITVKAGATSATSSVRTKPVLTSTVATFTATLDGGFTKTISVTILPPVVTNLFVTPATQVSGDDVLLLVVLDGAAASGFSVPITSNSSLIKPPSTLTFVAGNSAAMLTLNTTAFAGVVSKKVTLKVGGKSIVVTLLPSL